jgi:hypothetical protein
MVRMAFSRALIRHFDACCSSVLLPQARARCSAGARSQPSVGYSRDRPDGDLGHQPYPTCCRTGRSPVAVRGASLENQRSGGHWRLITGRPAGCRSRRSAIAHHTRQLGEHLRQGRLIREPSEPLAVGVVAVVTRPSNRRYEVYPKCSSVFANALSPMRDTPGQACISLLFGWPQLAFCKLS